MNNEPQYDEKLWFIHIGCEDKHYLLGNPHTFEGRMYAWCPKKKTAFCISESEIGEKSIESEYWIKGFLSGNEKERKKMKTYNGLIGFLEPYQISVVGTNPEGRHGAGTAKLAMQHHGLKYGHGRGRSGQSYGLITKNLTPFYFERITGIEYKTAGLRSVSTEQIVDNIKELYLYAIQNPDLEFHVAYTDSNNNLNGYAAQEMADMFCCTDIPDNMVFHEGFAKLLKI